MAIEIKEEKKFSFEWLFQAFFILSILTFLVSTGVLIYLQFFNIQPNIDKLTQLKTDLQSAKPSQAGVTEVEAATIQEYIDNFKALYDQRPILSKFFSNSRFESWIHPNIYLSNFSLDTNARTISVKGYTNDFKPLIEQLRVFKIMRDGAKGIEQYEVSDIKLSEKGGVSFSLILTVKPEELKK